MKSDKCGYGKMEKECAKALPFTVDLTVLSEDNLDQVCHFLALHGYICGYPRA